MDKLLDDSGNDEDIHQDRINKGYVQCIFDKLVLNQRWMIKSMFAFNYITADPILSPDVTAIVDDLSESPSSEEQALLLDESQASNTNEFEDEVLLIDESQASIAVESEEEDEEEDLE